VHGADVPQAGDRAADGGARYPNVGPTDFYAVVAGRHYDYTSTTYELDNALTSTTINKGENVVGVIVFDVPATHGTLLYSPNYQGEPIGKWVF
jgi:hypothetical protein